LIIKNIHSIIATKATTIIMSRFAYVCVLVPGLSWIAVDAEIEDIFDVFGKNFNYMWFIVAGATGHSELWLPPIGDARSRGGTSGAAQERGRLLRHFGG
jgi:hypothetical protein